MGMKFDSVGNDQKTVIQNVIDSQNKQIFCNQMKVMHPLINSAIWSYKIKSGEEFIRVEFISLATASRACEGFKI